MNHEQEVQIPLDDFVEYVQTQTINLLQDTKMGNKLKRILKSKDYK